MSIAENLNCDYSDISNLHDEGESSENEENCTALGEDTTMDYEADITVKIRVQQLLFNIILCVLFVFFKIIHMVYQLPVILTVILAILFLIKCYL